MKIGLLGVGTVGGGVVNILNKNQNLINKRAGSKIEIIIAAVKNITEPRICDISTDLVTEDAFAVVNHPEVEVVLELIGGNDIAKNLVETALKNQKSVITANKALIATYGNQLLQLAKDNKVALLFEASVAGGIPIIKSIQQGLSANKIHAIVGIINGTANFILSEMSSKKRNFDNVLKQAQKLGYAEANPSFDIDGIDAAHKLAILSALAFAHPLAFDKVITEGISDITPKDIEFAAELGFVIKHLGIAKQSGDGVQMRVHPTLISNTTLIGQINGVKNAVFINSDALGDSLYYGAGAGSSATASAVLADVIDLSNNTHTITDLSAYKAINFLNEDQIQSEYYLRLKVSDKIGVLGKIGQILSTKKISMETIIQHPQAQQAHIAIITNKIKHKQLKQAINDIQKCDFNQQAIHSIRVERL